MGTVQHVLWSITISNLPALTVFLQLEKQLLLSQTGMVLKIHHTRCPLHR